MALVEGCRGLEGKTRWIGRCGVEGAGNEYVHFDIMKIRWFDVHALEYHGTVPVGGVWKAFTSTITI